MNEIEQLKERVAYLEGVIANLMKSGEYTLNKDSHFYRKLQFADGVNMQMGTTTGSMIGTSSTQKLAFFGATPVIRETTAPSTVAGVNFILRQYGLLAP